MLGSEIVGPASRANWKEFNKEEERQDCGLLNLLSIVKMDHLLRKVLDVFQMLVEVPVDGGELNDGGSVALLKVLVDVRPETLLSLTRCVQVPQLVHRLTFHLFKHMHTSSV